jgi:hypothetical protein
MTAGPINVAREAGGPSAGRPPPCSLVDEKPLPKLLVPGRARNL